MCTSLCTHTRVCVGKHTLMHHAHEFVCVKIHICMDRRSGRGNLEPANDADRRTEVRHWGRGERKRNGWEWNTKRTRREREVFDTRSLRWNMIGSCKSPIGGSAGGWGRRESSFVFNCTEK